ncbi:unnamed protein product [Cuscuta campestris]|uniref:SANTA domain-containing protein n=1 Tax=Cuscuta campestris TaxID=132261 RepID=A0A484K854_9ASTE|nr:unnamed protein product [Cuscuta campestris]
MEKSGDPTNNSRPNSIAISLPFVKEMYLSDWWLIKVSEPGQIGVAGFTFKEYCFSSISVYFLLFRNLFVEQLLVLFVFMLLFGAGSVSSHCF